MVRWNQTALLATLLATAALIAGLAGGVALDRLVLARYSPPGNIRGDAAPSFELMAEAWNAIEQAYVDRSAVISETLTYGAIGGMVDALGDTGHSRFLSPEMRQQEKEQLQGSFEGIGAYVEMKDGQVVIVSPIDGSPAEAAGLRAGDIILTVDGESLTGLTLDEAISRIRGPRGTEVSLTVRSPTTGRDRGVTVTRAKIKETRVTWSKVPGTDSALIRIVSFSNGVSADLEHALLELQEEGCAAIILDLRNNPGGLLSEAIGVASQFLEGGIVLQQRDASGTLTPVPVTEGGIALDLPLVVLINQGSASASEIVAGALQDAGRATLVGETTFGTGTVLSTIGLSDGSALLLATQEWRTPAGRVIWHQGIEPAVMIVLPDTGTILTPKQVQEMTPGQVESSGDTQLAEAVRLLLDN
ncbi:MAG TPA: S41 family peptidase [Anaerolineae bacterium]|nr:S41 family peptidase [Anaerolineae bacterium]